MTVIKKCIFINAPLEKIHNFGVNPNNYVLYNDGLSDPQDIKGNGEVGTTGNFKVLVMGKQYPITVTITECTLGPDGCITKTEISGSFSGKQVMTAKRVNGGTEFTSELEYTLPGSIFGLLADKLLVEKKQESSMEQTLKNLKDLCEK